ncbi:MULTISPECIES: hypothetical protein [Alteribacter]|uniref:Cytochrome-c oxidase n=1 Tax=Alteribacter keqinensis TaxID=2483800 RepID=A0A3M7TSR9_9BACI|nr:MULTISPECIES: hypothetical protein [Alteribacter]MBM7097041.1 hypothetical protein [Alteribacter salitolerans]RNA67383.1 hypothetical protein EBO34_11620 [Alteribacter keqinensis]
MNRTRTLLRFAALFALVGTFIGSHMAGAGSYALRPMHAHILVVGWLSLFAFAVFYRLFPIPKDSKLAKVQVWSAIIGSITLPTGMYWEQVITGGPLATFALIYYIVGGSILLISFVLFFVMTFTFSSYIDEKKID